MKRLVPLILAALLLTSCVEDLVKTIDPASVTRVEVTSVEKGETVSLSKDEAGEVIAQLCVKLVFDRNRVDEDEGVYVAELFLSGGGSEALTVNSDGSACSLDEHYILPDDKKIDLAVFERLFKMPPAEEKEDEEKPHTPPKESGLQSLAGVDLFDRWTVFDSDDLAMPDSWLYFTSRYEAKDGTLRAALAREDLDGNRQLVTEIIEPERADPRYTYEYVAGSAEGAEKLLLYFQLTSERSQIYSPYAFDVKNETVSAVVPDSTCTKLVIPEGNDFRGLGYIAYTADDGSEQIAAVDLKTAKLIEDEIYDLKSDETMTDSLGSFFIAGGGYDRRRTSLENAENEGVLRLTVADVPSNGGNEEISVFYYDCREKTLTAE